MAANAAVTIARLGGRVAYWGRVAEDALGQRILGDLAAEGVDVAAAHRIPGARSPVSSILVTDAGDRLICSYSAPALDHDASWLPLGRVSEFTVVLADVRWPQGAAAILDAARRFARPALLDADVADPAVLADLAGRATHALFSEPGLVACAGEAAPGAALRRIERDTHAVVGVTMGAEGFLWREAGREYHEPAISIQPVDTLAAGDVWHGAFALAVAERMPTARAAVFANAAATLKCLRPGGRLGAPTRTEVEALLQHHQY